MEACLFQTFFATLRQSLHVTCYVQKNGSKRELSFPLIFSLQQKIHVVFPTTTASPATTGSWGKAPACAMLGTRQTLTEPSRTSEMTWKESVRSVAAMFSPSQTCPSGWSSRL